jgi:hypothetical protein
MALDSLATAMVGRKRIDLESQGQNHHQGIAYKLAMAKT